jgi:glycolate oxidase
MQAVKKALDPRGIMNPGKMFKEVRIWKFPKLQIHLPWDHK